MTIHTKTGSRGNASPGGDTEVNRIVQQLLTDPDFVISLVVNNNYAAVLERYGEVTGKRANIGREQLTQALQRMRTSGQKAQVTYCVSVPWEPATKTTAVDRAVASLRSESVARMSDPALPAFKWNLPGTPDDEDIPSGSGGNSLKGGNDTTNNNEFWNSLPGILTGLGGLVGAFTGKGGAAPSQAPPPPITSGSNTLIIVVVVVVVIGAVALAIKYFKKK